MGLYQTYKTDKKFETEGIWLDYGTTRIRIARAGRANKKFSKRFNQLIKPFKKALQHESLDTDTADDVMRQVYSEVIILAWETKLNGKWKSGIEAENDKKLLDFNKENVQMTLKNLPDLFTDLQEASQKMSLFRQDVLEEDSKN